MTCNVKEKKNEYVLQQDLGRIYIYLRKNKDFS